VVHIRTHVHYLLAPQPRLHTPHTCVRPLCTQTPSTGTHTCTLPQAWRGHVQALCVQLFEHPSTFPAWVHAHTRLLQVCAGSRAYTGSWLSHTHTHTHMFCSNSAPLHTYRINQVSTANNLQFLRVLTQQVSPAL